MSIVETLQVITLAIALISGVGVPVSIWRMNQQNHHREQMRQEILEKFDHLDLCVDDLRKRVMGEMCSRTELNGYKAETAETLNRMRLAISSETNGLHDRIMRLENTFLGHKT